MLLEIVTSVIRHLESEPRQPWAHGANVMVAARSWSAADPLSASSLSLEVIMLKSMLVSVVLAIGLSGCVIGPAPVSAQVVVPAPAFTCYDVYGQTWTVEYPCASYVGLAVVYPAIVLPLPFGYVRPGFVPFVRGFRPGHFGRRANPGRGRVFGRR